MIIRFHRARVHHWQEEAFTTFLLEKALPVARKYDGLVPASVGLPHESYPGEFSEEESRGG